MRTCLSSLFSSETTLKYNHNFLIESLSHLLTAFLRQERQFNYIPAHHLGQAVNSFTAKSVPAGMKNSRSEGFLLAKHKHTNITTIRSPIQCHGFDG